MPEKTFVKDSLALGVFLLGVSIFIYKFFTSGEWATELAKALMELSFTAIFGSIVKLIFDKYQEDKKREEEKKTLNYPF